MRFRIFIGVWDTVAALQSRVWLLMGVLVATLALTAVVAAIARSVASSIFGEFGFWPVFFSLFIVELAGIAVWYFATHINVPKSDRVPRTSFVWLRNGVLRYDSEPSCFVRPARDVHRREQS